MQPISNIPKDELLFSQLLMNLAGECDKDFQEACLKTYNKTTKPDQYPSWEAYYKALSTPTESDAPSSD